MSEICLINENVPNAKQPDNITIKLKEHQLKLLQKCYDLENNTISDLVNKNVVNTKMGIIGDTVGSGKSLVILSLITQNNIYREDNNYTSYNELITLYKINSKIYNNKNTNILVVPHNIFIQWQEYIKIYTLIDTYYINTKKQLINIDYTKQLILISASMYNTFADNIEHLNFKFLRLIFDEADSINISRCRKVNANFYWFITSSINNLIYPTGLYYRDKTIIGIPKNGFIKDIFKSLQYANINRYIYLKNSDKLIKKSFDLPEPIINNIICKNTKIRNILQNIVSQDVQQMICAGDINGAIHSLGLEITNDTNLITIISNDLYSLLNNKKLELDLIEKREYRYNNKKITDIKKKEKEINEIEIKINQIKTRIEESNIDPITLDKIENPIIVKCCKQVFDFISITTLISMSENPKCPMCRTIITKDSLVSMNNGIISFKPLIEKAIEYNYLDYTKNENLEYIIKNKVQKNAKIIIFSKYNATFDDNILPILNSLNMNFKELKGHSTTIANIINKYKSIDENAIDILFLNAQYSGSGLNLENTTDIIIYHKMDKSLQTQVIGRAQRIGRKNQLKVWNLLYEDE